MHLKPTENADLAIWLITFSLAVLADLVAAVSIGVILPIVQLLRRMSKTSKGRSSRLKVRPPIGTRFPHCANLLLNK